MQDKTNNEPDIIELEEQAVEELLETRYLTKENAHFSRTKGGFAALDFDGKHYDRIAVHRAFPFTDPYKYLSIRDTDEKAHEIGMIYALDELEEDQRQILMDQINLRYFTPIIQKVLDIKEEYGYSYWDTITDKGACRFTIRANSVVKLTETRLLITDIDGNRFEIPNVMNLTPKELKLVDLYL